jgi:hypothetical protein
MADIKAADGTTVVKDEEKAHMFNKCFSSVFTQEDLQHVPNFSTKGEAHLKSIDISEEEVCKLLKGLQPE